MGDPLVLVHDLHGGASGEDFERNVSAINNHFTVYRLDLAGFGLSDGRQLRYHARDYPALLNAFVHNVVGLPVHIGAVGASVAFVATAAAERPDLFIKQVFISPDVSSRPARRGQWVTRILREAFWLALVTPPFRFVFRDVMAGEWELGEFLRRTVFDPRSVDPSKLGRLQELAREAHALNAYASHEAGFLTAPFEANILNAARSTLFICGREVESDYAAAVEQLAQLAKGRIEWVKKAKLWPHYEAPRDTDELIIDFLRRDESNEFKYLKRGRALAAAFVA
jgi:pimeloyl-ACP methyl ester carboxylesterase